MDSDAWSKENVMGAKRTLAVAVVATVCCVQGQAVAMTSSEHSAGAMKPARVHCGQIIRADTVVANDLHACPDIGLAIGAPNITLDLNGHTIQGNGQPLTDCPEEEPCNSGIANSEIDGLEVVNGPGFPGVTIRNGTVRGFAGVGLYEFGVSNNQIAGVAVAGTDDGVILTRSSASRIDRVHVAGFQFVGFDVSHSHDVAVLNSSASDGPGVYGFLLSDAHDTLVARDRSASVPDADGIAVLNGSSDNTVRANKVTGDGGAISVDDSAGNLVTRNDVHDNLFIGIYANNGDRNRFTHNRIARNSDGSAGGLVLDSDDNGTSDGNLLAGNTLLGNVGDGILVTPGQSNTAIEDNVANNNSGDGIDAQSGSATISANTANHNGALGIDAAAGSIDGGSNHAAANGDPRQCVGVVCS
jgi:parallel beta-helix repeat protein